MRPVDYQNMLKELLEVESGLSAWEMDFLDSLVSQGFLGRTDFSEKQRDKLEQIWGRIFK